jgi:lipoprotein-anchoring transpeptidase ErfK/SrfK
VARRVRFPGPLVTVSVTAMVTGLVAVGVGLSAAGPDARQASPVTAVAPAAASAVAGPGAVAASGPPAGAAPDTGPLDPDAGYAVTARRARLEVRDAPRGDVVHTLASPTAGGAPLVLLLAEDPGTDWLRVLLPVRPNGSSGWVRRADVTFTAVPYRLVMSTREHRLVVELDGRPVRTFSAASGTGGTPTPTGTFYVTELLRPTNAGYGPFAFGLSGHSEVLTSFGGGAGRIGVHGTDDASSIGRAASHGCIRLSDADITWLAERLPLGTPVVVT